MFAVVYVFYKDRTEGVLEVSQMYIFSRTMHYMLKWQMVFQTQ